MKQRIIIGLTGASGVVYGIRALRHLRELGGWETHLVMSAGAETNIQLETADSIADVKQLADVVHRVDNLAASIASGSFRTAGMIVIPCSIKTLSGIVHSYADNLLIRAADVCLKEQRRLVLVVRETPLHHGHLQLLVQGSAMGAIMVPPMPAFYHRPQSIEDLIDHTIGKVFDLFEIEHQLYRRWGEAGPSD